MFRKINFIKNIDDFIYCFRFAKINNITGNVANYWKIVRI